MYCIEAAVDMFSSFQTACREQDFVAVFLTVTKAMSASKMRLHSCCVAFWNVASAAKQDAAV